MRQHGTTIILGTAHRLREPGKQSCDGRLVECIYSREIVREVAAKLQGMGYPCPGRCRRPTPGWSGSASWH